MPNLRIISDNAADRATLTASTPAGLLVAANLLSDKKSQVYRSTTTSATFTLTWTAAETISVVCFPFCNLSPTATMRVRAYASDGTTVVYDTGTNLACAAPARRRRGWTAAQAASAYAYGGGNCAWRWFAPISAFKLVIDIIDTSNLQAAVEAAARIIAASYWAPTYNATAAPWKPVDSTELYRNAAGDQMADAGTVRRELSIDFSLMPPADRTKLANILLDSRAYPILISVFPECGDAELERDNMIYGRRPEDSEIAIQFATAYGSKIAVEEI